MPVPISLALAGALAPVGTPGSPALGGSADDADAPVSFSIRLTGADVRHVAQPVAVAEPIQPPPSRPGYGKAGSAWWTFGGGAAFDFDDAVDYNGHVAFTYFLVDQFEAGVELAGWYLDQDDDAVGINPVLLFRWHLIARERWTFYLDAGIGVLFSTDSVPEGGTHLNFTPRVGVGITHALGDSGTRLQLGVRWHHISNARITGDRDNPARDAPLIYAAVIIPF